MTLDVTINLSQIEQNSRKTEPQEDKQRTEGDKKFLSKRKSAKPGERPIDHGVQYHMVIG
jgi:hypothetical protein